MKATRFEYRHPVLLHLLLLGLGPAKAAAEPFTVSAVEEPFIVRAAATVANSGSKRVTGKPMRGFLGIIDSLRVGVLPAR